VSVTVNGVATPIQFASPNQINVQVPWGVQLSDSVGAGQVVVTNAGTASAGSPVTIAASAPAIYNLGGQAISLASQAAKAAKVKPSNRRAGSSCRNPACRSDAGQCSGFRK